MGTPFGAYDKQNNMFIGEYIHTVDEKKRISLPSKFRKEAGKKLVATRGLDNCLFLYTRDEWQRISDQIGSLGMAGSDQRSISRFMFAGAQEVSVDSVGRILIPDYLRGFAGIKGKVVFAGVHNRIEVWDEKKWQEYKKVMETQAEKLSEKLGDIGAF